MSTVHTAHATYHLDVSVVSGTTINIHIYAECDAGWGSGSFASGIGWSATGNSGTFNISGSSAEIANYNTVISGNTTVTAHINDTGTEAYGGPVDIGQFVEVLTTPSAPQNLAVSATGGHVIVTFTGPASNGGAAIINYTIQYSKDGGAWTGTVTNVSGTQTFDLPSGSYRFRVWANNSQGAGAIATSSSVDVHSGGSVRVGGVWKPGIFKVRVDGAWKDAIVKVRSGGAWKNGI